MLRSCLLCVGTKDRLKTLIDNRENSGARDYMKNLFCISCEYTVEYSCILFTPNFKELLPKNEILHPGYCGEECRNILIENGHEDKYVICGIECPGYDSGYKTFDIVFPQGKCEKNESQKLASMREFQEETGINISIYEKQLKFGGFVGRKKEMAVWICSLE